VAPGTGGEFDSASASNPGLASSLAADCVAANSANAIAANVKNFKRFMAASTKKQKVE
jgi:hypothetical protein